MILLFPFKIDYGCYNISDDDICLIIFHRMFAANIKNNFSSYNSLKIDFLYGDNCLHKKNTLQNKITILEPVKHHQKQPRELISQEPVNCCCVYYVHVCKQFMGDSMQCNLHLNFYVETFCYQLYSNNQYSKKHFDGQ